MWFSNWLVTAPSMVQWPVLCGRMASSLTTIRPSRASISSTASTPTTPSSAAMLIAITWSSAARPSSSPGAGVTVSTQMPSSCVVWLIG